MAKESETNSLGTYRWWGWGYQCLYGGCVDLMYSITTTLPSKGSPTVTSVVYLELSAVLFAMHGKTYTLYLHATALIGNSRLRKECT